MDDMKARLFAAAARRIATGVAAIGDALSDSGRAAQRAGRALRRYQALCEIRQWVEYDRAGAPYGYRRAGLELWLKEKH